MCSNWSQFLGFNVLFWGEWKIAWFVPWTFFVSWLTVELLIARCYRCRMSLFGKTLCGNQFPFLDLFSSLGQLALETHTANVLSFFHHPPTKLREVNVCLFTGEGVPCDHFPWGIGPHYSGPLNPSPWASPPPDIRPHCALIPWAQPPDKDLTVQGNSCQWHLVSITGDQFKLFTSGSSLASADIWWLLKHVWLVQPIGAVCILLECFFVLFCFLLFRNPSRTDDDYEADCNKYESVGTN